MMKPAALLALAIALPGIALGASGAARAADERSVLAFHGAADRSGNFVVPGLTAERARGIRLDDGFQAKLAGHLYAQPLYWSDSGTGAGVLIAATESNAGQP